MTKTINGWTKARMIEAIQTRMMDHRSVRLDDAGNPIGCRYKAPDGNRCAVGVFIPDNHPAENHGGAVGHILDKYVDLRELMPLPADSLYILQGIHDCCRRGDPRPLLINWINENVEDSK